MTDALPLVTTQRELTPSEDYSKPVDLVLTEKTLGTTSTNGTTQNLSSRLFLSDVDGKKLSITAQGVTYLDTWV